MRPCSRAELARGALDCFVSGSHFVHFRKNPTFWGVLFWGRPGRDDLLPLLGSLPLELAGSTPRFGSILDVSRVTGIDRAVFELFDGYVRERFEALARAVVRAALVHPSGVEGAVAAGFYEVLPRPYPFRTFANARAALDWLAEEPSLRIPADFADELELLYARVTRTPPLVTALGAQLNENLRSPSMARACKALGISQRTLQRRLREANTSFQQEVQRARMRTAERLLLDTDAPLSAIALDIGYTSLQRFSTLFKKVAGESPSEWRARRRSER
jgi:AraC-like DNA-binding protein